MPYQNRPQHLGCTCGNQESNNDSKDPYGEEKEERKLSGYEVEYNKNLNRLTNQDSVELQKEMSMHTDFRKRLESMREYSVDALLEEIEMRQDSIREYIREKDKLENRVTKLSHNADTQDSRINELEQTRYELREELTRALTLVDTLTSAVREQSKSVMKRVK